MKAPKVKVEKRGRGQPKSPYEHRVQVRLRAGEIKVFTKIANAQGLTLSAWMRMALYTAAREGGVTEELSA